MLDVKKAEVLAYTDTFSLNYLGTKRTEKEIPQQVSHWFFNAMFGYFLQSLWSRDILNNFSLIDTVPAS